MPRRIGRSRPSKPGLSSGNLAFREKQRKQSFAQMDYPATYRKKQEKPIELKPFMEIPEIKTINSPDSISRIINGTISPSKSLENAVKCLMINLLESHSDIYKPKKEYSKEEKQYIREQLKVFTETLSTLEVSFSQESKSLGEFKSKDEYRGRKKVGELPKLLESSLWKGEGSYPLIYLGQPSDVLFNKRYEESIAEEIIFNRYKERIDKLESELLKVADEKDKKKIDIFKELDMESEPDELLFFRKCIQQLKERPNYQGPGRKYLEIAAEIGKIIDQMQKEVQEETKKLPDETGIATKISKNLMPNGIMILESSEKMDIPGLRLVESYENVRLYQKEK